MTATWGGRARARLGALAFSVALAACGGESPKLQETPRAVEVGSFVGEVNLVTGEMSITPTGVAPVSMALTFRGNLEQIPVEQNGVWGDVGEGAVEMRTVLDSTYVWTAACAADGATTYEADVAIHSGFAGTKLVRPYLEITSLDQTGFESCFSAPSPRSPPEPALSSVRGLFQYPDIDPHGVSTATWSFRVGNATSFRFVGRVWAEREDRTPPTTSASPAPGTYTAPQTLTLTCSDGTGSDAGCANTYYSVEGATTTYVGPIHLSGNETICYWSEDLRGNVEADQHCAAYTTGASAGTASYDSTLHVPRCSSLARSCDTGTLVTGRGTMTSGNEPQSAVNVIDGCVDGNLGTYGTAESLDRLVLRTDDGGPLAAGRPVHVDGDVIANSGAATTPDRFEVYWASTTASGAISWQQAGSTVTVSTPGSQTVSVPFTLPAGAIAIRGRFGQAAAGVSCGATGTDDQDDIVFIQDVAPPPSAAPSVTLATPTSTDSVSGGVLLRATVPVDADVASVQFLWRSGGGTGAFTSIGYDFSPPWVFSWDATHFAGTSVDFQALVTDRAGATASSSVVTAGLVEQPPTVAIVDVANGASFSTAGGTQTVTIDAAKYNGVANVELWIDGAIVAADGPPNQWGPFLLTFDPGTLATGIRHTMAARAYDYTSTVAQTIPIHFTVY